MRTPPPWADSPNAKQINMLYKHFKSYKFVWNIALERAWNGYSGSKFDCLTWRVAFNGMYVCADEKNLRSALDEVSDFLVLTKKVFVAEPMCALYVWSDAVDFLHSSSYHVDAVAVLGDGERKYQAELMRPAVYALEMSEELKDMVKWIGDNYGKNSVCN